MDIQKLYKQSINEFDQRVKLIQPDQWNKPTPNTEWNIRNLVNHLTYENLWVPELLEGKTIDEIGSKFEGDVLGTQPLLSWTKAASGAASAADQADMHQIVHLSFGDVPASEYLNQLFCDHLIHTWDLATALKLDFRVNPELVEACYNYISPQADSWRQAGLFGPVIDVPPESNLLTRLLALTGRKA